MDIVFDLGGVVFDWDPERIIAACFDDPTVQSRVREGIFAHPDWLSLDRGTLPLPTAIARFAVRTGLPERAVARVMASVPPSLTPKRDTVEILKSLRRKGHRMYYLSNMHLDSIDYLEKHFPFADYFDGSVVSCRVQQIKPEAGIYRHLLEQYDLNAGACVFIDDVQANLDGASRQGLKTILFTDAQQCVRQLRTLLG